QRWMVFLFTKVSFWITGAIVHSAAGWIDTRLSTKIFVDSTNKFVTSSVLLSYGKTSETNRRRAGDSPRLMESRSEHRQASPGRAEPGEEENGLYDGAEVHADHGREGTGPQRRNAVRPRV